MPSSKNSSRLLGVELTRGFAAYGVIVIHAGLVCGSVRTPAAIYLQYFFCLTCVPFFLVASFYFAALSSSPTETFLPWLKQRSQRLLVPYAIWTLIYTGLQVLQVLAHPGRMDGLRQLLSDPLGRFFFGASGMALYFLPLLFVGFLVQRVLAPVFAPRSPLVLGLGCLVALFLSSALILSGNDDIFSQVPPFQPLLSHWFGSEQSLFWSTLAPVRFVLVVLAFAIHCLPYIFLGWICARLGPWPLSSHSHRALTALPSLFLLIFVTLAGYTLLTPLLGCAALLLAIALSPAGNSHWIILMGRYSFAIYLMHQVILEVVKFACHGHLHLLTLPLMIPLSLAVFAICFAIAWLSDQFGGKLARATMALP